MKKIIFTLSLLISLLMFSQVAFAQSLSYMETNAEVGWKDVVFNTNIIFKEMPEKFTYPTFYDIENFRSSANFKNYECNVKETDWGNEITCDLSEVSGDGKTLKWSYETDDILKDIENKRMVDFEIKLPFKTEKAVFRTTLKEGLVLTKENQSSSLVPFTPRNGTKGSNGRQIYVYWVRENLPKGEDFGLSLIYEKVNPSGNGSDNTVLILLIGSVFLAFILFFFILKGKKENNLELSVLKEDEREIYEIIERYGGECKQKRIVNETDYSKAKVSRMVKNLKERNLIGVEKVGRTNRIRIKKNDNQED